MNTDRPFHFHWSPTLVCNSSAVRIASEESHWEGKNQVYVPIYRQQGASSLEVANGVHDHLQEIQDACPPGTKLDFVMDQTIFVRQAIKSLIQEGIVGAALVSVMILIFLGNWRMTLIASMSIPLARSVGTQSSVERLCAGLSTDLAVDPPAMGRSVQAQLPDGCRIVDVQCVEGKQVFYAAGVNYVFTVSEPLDRNRLAACQALLAEGGCIEIQRYRAKKRKWETFDLSPFVERLAFTDDRIEVSCRVSQAGTVRVDELMQWMGLSAGMLTEPVRRTTVGGWARPGSPH